MKKTILRASIYSFIFTYFVFSFVTWNLNPLPSSDSDFRIVFIVAWLISYVVFFFSLIPDSSSRSGGEL